MSNYYTWFYIVYKLKNLDNFILIVKRKNLVLYAKETKLNMFNMSVNSIKTKQPSYSIDKFKVFSNPFYQILWQRIVKMYTQTV